MNMSVTSALLGPNNPYFTLFPQHPILERPLQYLPLVWVTNFPT